MSSTTDRGQGRSGQALVLFTFGLVVFLGIAAMVFDVGQALVDRRAQQNAADAAALAGARYITQGSCQTNSTPSNCPAVVQAAVDAAARNGYVNGQNGITVAVKIPPGSDSPFDGLSGYVEVQIGSSRQSIFAGALGINSWKVGTTAVAANQSGISAPYSFLALDPTACPAALFSGQAVLNVGGNIQVDSSCVGAMQVTGQADVTVTVPQGQCSVVGTVQQGGKAQLNCSLVQGAQTVPDPLASLPPPPQPGAPTNAVQVGGTAMAVPAACPGGLAQATAANPATCRFTSSYAGTTWRLFPGYYPGGIQVQGGTVLLEPGIYYLAGGGLQANGTSAALYSVNAGGSAPPMAGGVLLYNTEDASFHSQCAAGTAPAPAVDCLQPISMQGASTVVGLDPLEQGTVWDGLVIFQDRALSMSPTATPLASRTADLLINGNGASITVDGTIYEPSGYVQINGNGGYNSNTQVIADEFKVNGNSGTMNVTYGGGSLYKFSGVGLVQ
ncbi:MAG TPA: pilus assembly protein TadG-related protein [Candidatus Limnocylindrales bacterium]